MMVQMMKLGSSQFQRLRELEFKLRQSAATLACPTNRSPASLHRH
uniref:Alternative protein CD84 n=1 Tax=Homo sapiens TaxID=9606 RepID=L8E7X8_HUMAN|nr:alternative protein CD84 [Homo sapiens]